MYLLKLVSAFLLITLLVCEIEASPSQRNNQVKLESEVNDDGAEYLDAIEDLDLTAYLDDYESNSSALCNKATVADWEYNIDLNSAEKQEASNLANLEYAKFQFEEWNDVIKHLNDSPSSDEMVNRQIKFLKKIGTAALSQTDLSEYNNVISNMSRIFGSSKVCPYAKQDCNLQTEGLNLDPDLEAILSSSTNYDELTYVWKAWREATGKNTNMKQLYEKYVELSNKAAVANGEKNMGDFWILRYESDSFREEIAAVWKEVEGLYKELYGYVRFRLSSKYDQIKNNPEEPLPANVLGNMWAQTWDNIYPHVVPYPEAPVFDITEKLKGNFSETKEGVTEMFETANEFFTSLGLSDMSMAYGEKAMILRPDDGKEVICHASAWDFCDGEDYRIKMCTKVNQEDFVTIHHELGHIQYDLNYKNLPITFREGANPGFHEAIGDVVALSVETPKHMQKIGLWDENTGDDDKTTINYLMKMALQKVAFLPFGYMIDAYRWKIFDGTIKPEDYEYQWLKIRNELQGVIPPVARSAEDFDAGAKYHVPGNTPYIRYFVSFILQFQIHEALCKEAGHDVETDIHTCDIYQNDAAGIKFKEILEAGFSMNWQDLLESGTGSRTLDARPIKHYFKTLSEFFKQQQTLHKYSTTWRDDAFAQLYGAGNDADDDTELAAIIVGAVLGVAVLVLVLGYFLKKKIFKSS